MIFRQKVKVAGGPSTNPRSREYWPVLHLGLRVSRETGAVGNRCLSPWSACIQGDGGCGPQVKFELGPAGFLVTQTADETEAAPGWIIETLT